MKRVQFPQDFFCTQTWPPSHCFVHKYGRRDVMWKRSIVIQWRKESIFSSWKLLQSFSPPKSTPFGWSIPLWSTIGRAHFGGCTCGYQSLPTSILNRFLFFAWVFWNCYVQCCDYMGMSSMAYDFFMPRDLFCLFFRFLFRSNACVIFMSFIGSCFYGLKNLLEKV